MSENPQLPSPSVSQSVKRDYLLTSLQKMYAGNSYLQSPLERSPSTITPQFKNGLRHFASDLTQPFK